MKKSEGAVNTSSLSKGETIISICIIGILFFIFGFISWINAILIPYFKISFELTNFQSYLVAFSFYISYLIMSVPSAYLLKNKGFKGGMTIGFIIMAVGAFTFVPAAYSHTYELFLLGLFLLGIGLAILQTAANPYITVLGSPNRAVQRISIMGICNKGAGILAPLIFAAVILKSSDNELFASLVNMDEEHKQAALNEMVKRVIGPYTVVGFALLLFGVLIRFSPLPELDTEHEDETLIKANADKTNIFQFPHLILGAIAIFLHVGTQVIAIDTVINYANSMGISLLKAKVFPSYTLAVTIVGYFIGVTMTPKYLSQLTTLKLCTLLGLLFSVLILFTSTQVDFLGFSASISIWFVVLLGLPNALIWAGIWPLALNGLGRFTKLGGSVLIMGLCGNALLPLLYGYFADTYSLQIAYAVVLPCYLYLVYYAFLGHKTRKWQYR